MAITYQAQDENVEKTVGFFRAIGHDLIVYPLGNEFAAVSDGFMFLASLEDIRQKTLKIDASEGKTLGAKGKTPNESIIKLGRMFLDTASGDNVLVSVYRRPDDHKTQYVAYKMAENEEISVVAGFETERSRTSPAETIVFANVP